MSPLSRQQKDTRKLLQSIGHRLRGIFGKDCTVGRLTGSYFTILVQDADQQHMDQIRSGIEEAISRLRKVGKWQCALTAQGQVTGMNQHNSSREIYIRSLQKLWAGLACGNPEK